MLVRGRVLPPPPWDTQYPAAPAHQAHARSSPRPPCDTSSRKSGITAANARRSLRERELGKVLEPERNVTGGENRLRGTHGEIHAAERRPYLPPALPGLGTGWARY